MNAPFARYYTFALASCLALCVGAPLASAQSRDVLLYPTFSAPPDSVLIDGVRVDYAPDVAIRVRPGARVVLEAFLDGMIPIRDAQRYAAGTIARPHYTFQSMGQLSLGGAAYTLRGPVRFARQDLVPALVPVGLAVLASDPESSGARYVAAIGVAAGVSGLIKLAFDAPPVERPDRGVRLMGGWMRSQFTGLEGVTSRTTVEPVTLVNAEGNTVDFAALTVVRSGGIAVGRDFVGTVIENMTTEVGQSGFTAQVGFDVYGRIGVRASYQQLAVPFAIASTSLVFDPDFDVRTLNTPAETAGRLRQRIVDALITVRVVRLGGNVLRVGAGPYVRFEANESLGVPLRALYRSAVYTTEQPASLSWRNEASRGVALMLSVTAEMTPRLAFVTQVRVYRAFGESTVSFEPGVPRESVDMVGSDERVDFERTARASAVLWSSGVELRLW